jgi:anti-sigma-K factor RskA
VTANEHDRYAEDLAPYVLGALSPIEENSLDEHLRTCAQCRQKVDELRAGAAVLARSVEAVEPPPSLREKLVQEVEAEHRQEPAGEASSPPRAPGRAQSRRRWGLSLGMRPALATVAASALLLLGGLAGWLLKPEQSPGGQTVAAVVDRERLPDARGKLAVAGNKDATLRLAGLPDLGARRNYEVWVQRHGEVSPGPVFGPSPSGTAVIGVPGGLEGVEAVLVTRERAGGARSPTEKPVVQVAVSS